MFNQVNKNQAESSHGRKTEFSLGEREKPKTARSDMLRKLPVSNNNKGNHSTEKTASNGKEEKVVIADDFRAAIISNNVAIIEECLSAGLCFYVTTAVW